MSARIRGHYRIDSAGRVESLLDVNGAALKFHAPPVARANQRNSRLVRISIAGCVTMMLCIGGMFALPQIERAIVTAQSQQFALVRHLHGHARHEMAEKLLHRESPT